MSAARAATAASREQALADLASAFKGTMAAVRRLRGRDTHRPGELSLAQYHLLHYLSSGELSTSELAVAADLAPATTTQMLDALVAMGLVARTRSERDRRIVTCVLTDRGSDAVAERRARFELRWQEALAGFDATELKTAAAVLERLRGLYDSLDRGR